MAPGIWFAGTDGPWEWKGPVIIELGFIAAAAAMGMLAVLMPKYV